MLSERFTYIFIVGNDFEVDSDKRSHGLKFRQPERLMQLGKSDQIFHIVDCDMYLPVLKPGG